MKSELNIQNLEVNPNNNDHVGLDLLLLVSDGWTGGFVGRFCFVMHDLVSSLNPKRAIAWKEELAMPLTIHLILVLKLNTATDSLTQLTRDLPFIPQSSSTFTCFPHNPHVTLS